MVKAERDYEPIDLTSLTNAFLANNQLTTLTVPPGLTNLTALVLNNNPIGRAPNCFSRENRTDMFQPGVMSKLASPVAALRVIAGTMKLSPGTS